MAYRSTKLQQEQTNFMDASTGDLRANGEVQRRQLTYNTQPMTFVRPLPRSV